MLWVGFIRNSKKYKENVFIYGVAGVPKKDIKYQKINRKSGSSRHKSQNTKKNQSCKAQKPPVTHRKPRCAAQTPKGKEIPIKGAKRPEKASTKKSRSTKLVRYPCDAPEATLRQFRAIGRGFPRQGAKAGM